MLGIERRDLGPLVIVDRGLHLPDCRVHVALDLDHAAILSAFRQARRAQVAAMRRLGRAKCGHPRARHDLTRVDTAHPALAGALGAEHFAVDILQLVRAEFFVALRAVVLGRLVSAQPRGAGGWVPVGEVVVHDVGTDGA
jgi:hypothetical protein